MPRFEKRQEDLKACPRPATVFERVASVIRRVGRKDVINLHLGDAHTLPPPAARPGALDERGRAGFSRYCDTSGLPELKDLLVKKLGEKNGMDWVGEDHLQVTCGAIHAIYGAFSALLEPGDEVMALSPHWHLVRGVIEQAGGVCRDVDFYIPLCRDPGSDVRALLESGLRKGTAAIYLNTPNNPTGKVLDRAHLQEVAEFAREHDLWVVSDEAYEDFIFTGADHRSMATLPGMRERTISVFSFSKCMAAAGYRVGYAAAAPEVIEKINTACTRTVYNAPTDNQHLVVQALGCWDAWFPGLHEKYSKNRDLVCRRFKGRFFEPEGGFYVFFDAREKLAGRAPEALLEEMAREGVAAVPGRAFGRGYDDWFRLCFAAVPKEILEQGIERLNRVMA